MHLPCIYFKMICHRIVSPRVGRYNDTMKEITAFPEDDSYRTEVENITKERLGFVTTSKSVAEFESKLGIQAEEAIQQAGDEMKLIDILKKEKGLTYTKY